jgi:hypothetical protein
MSSAVEPSPGDLGWFDCNALIGRSSAPVLGNWLGSQDLLAEMDRVGIAEALVAHTWGKEHLAAAANTALADAVAAVPRLHACGTLFPRHVPSEPPETEQVERLLRSGARAVRLHPNPTVDLMDESVHARHFSLHPVVVDALLDALATRRVPLLLEMRQVRWEEVYDLCGRHPTLPVLLLDVSYTHKRSLFAGLERFANLRFELSGYHVHQGLEEICRVFGAGRVLFGTRLPVYTAGSALAMVRYADIGPHEQRAIAGDNLRRLLGAVATDDGATAVASP